MNKSIVKASSLTDDYGTSCREMFRIPLGEVGTVYVCVDNAHIMGLTKSELKEQAIEVVCCEAKCSDQK